MNHPVVFYDSDCLVCSSFIQFLLKNDKNEVLRFSNFNTKLAKKLNINLDKNTLVLYKNDKLNYRSEAFREILKSIDFSKPLVQFLSIMPIEFQNLFYNIIARNRYHFGKTKSCVLIDKNRFITD